MGRRPSKLPYLPKAPAIEAPLRTLRLEALHSGFYPETAYKRRQLGCCPACGDPLDEARVGIGEPEYCPACGARQGVTP